MLGVAMCCSCMHSIVGHSLGGSCAHLLLCSELVAGGAYEYEFNIESCAGEVEEGLGGKVRRRAE